MLYVDEACRSFLCRIALTVVLIRAGIGVDLDAVKKTKVHFQHLQRYTSDLLVVVTLSATLFEEQFM